MYEERYNTQFTLLVGQVQYFRWTQKKGVKLSLSHASSLAGLVTQSGLETNASSRMMTHHPAWQTQNVAVPTRGQWSRCSGAGSAFVRLWLSRLKDNSTDNSWDQRLSLSHQETWFPPSAWSHGLPRAFSLQPPGARPRTQQSEPRQQSLGSEPTSSGCQALRYTPDTLRVCV